MVLLPQSIKVIWTGANRKYFESKGYIFTGYNTSFQVNPHHLQPNSDKWVKVKCTVCKRQKEIQYKVIRKVMDKDQDYVCYDCRGNKISITKVNYYAQTNASVDTNVFLKNTPELAYLAGLIATDGTVSKENFRIELSMTDRDVVQWVHDFTKCKNPIKYYMPKKSSHKPQWKVAFSNKIARDALKKYGIVPNKSLIIEFPKIAKDLIPHFIRGVFDGDGSVVSNDSQYQGFLQVMFKTGSSHFAEGLKETIQSECGINCSLIRTPQCETVYYTVSFTKWENIVRFYEWIYSGNYFFMKRKRQKYEYFMEEYLRRRSK